MVNASLILKYRWRVLSLLLVSALLAAVLLRWWQGAEVAIERLQPRDFVQTVVASGHVETPHRADIGSQVTGVVRRVPVSEGQSVQAGDLLIELDATELRANERMAAVAVTQAQARLRQLREVQAPVAEQGLRQAQLNLENARRTLARNQELFDKKFISQAGLDDARQAVDLADAQVRSARKQFDTALSEGSDTEIALAAVAQAEASLQAARARSAYAQVRAPRDGTLIARNVEVGDVVQPGKVLMTLSPAGRTQLVVEIDEKNLRLLALGQKALASADAFAQQRFAAELAYINPGVNAQTGSVQVKLDLPKPPANLQQDMTVSVDIEVARHAQVLVLASSAVHDAEGPAPWVLLLEDGRALRRTLRLGLRSGGWAEVLEGLQAGDAVITSSPAPAPGERVHSARTE